MNFLGVSITSEPQHDGAKWRRYQTATGITLIVSQAFHDIIHGGSCNILNEDNKTAKRILCLLHQYRDAIIHIYDDENNQNKIRRFIVEGGEAEFFALGDTNLGIREVIDYGKGQEKIGEISVKW